VYNRQLLGHLKVIQEIDPPVDRSHRPLFTEADVELMLGFIYYGWNGSTGMSCMPAQGLLIAWFVVILFATGWRPSTAADIVWRMTKISRAPDGRIVVTIFSLYCKHYRPGHIMDATVIETDTVYCPVKMLIAFFLATGLIDSEAEFRSTLDIKRDKLPTFQRCKYEALKRRMAASKKVYAAVAKRDGSALFPEGKRKKKELTAEELAAQGAHLAEIVSTISETELDQLLIQHGGAGDGNEDSPNPRKDATAAADTANADQADESGLKELVDDDHRRPATDDEKRGIPIRGDWMFTLPRVEGHMIIVNEPCSWLHRTRSLSEEIQLMGFFNGVCYFLRHSFWSLSRMRAHARGSASGAAMDGFGPTALNHRNSATTARYFMASAGQSVYRNTMIQGKLDMKDLVPASESDAHFKPNVTIWDDIRARDPKSHLSVMSVLGVEPIHSASARVLAPEDVRANLKSRKSHKSVKKPTSADNLTAKESNQYKAYFKRLSLRIHDFPYITKLMDVPKWSKGPLFRCCKVSEMSRKLVFDHLIQAHLPSVLDDVQRSLKAARYIGADGKTRIPIRLPSVALTDSLTPGPAAATDADTAPDNELPEAHSATDRAPAMAPIPALDSEDEFDFDDFPVPETAHLKRLRKIGNASNSIAPTLFDDDDDGLGSPSRNAPTSPIAFHIEMHSDGEVDVYSFEGDDFPSSSAAAVQYYSKRNARPALFSSHQPLSHDGSDVPLFEQYDFGEGVPDRFSPEPDYGGERDWGRSSHAAPDDDSEAPTTRKRKRASSVEIDSWVDLLASGGDDSRDAASAHGDDVSEHTFRSQKMRKRDSGIDGRSYSEFQSAPAHHYKQPFRNQTEEPRRAEAERTALVEQRLVSENENLKAVLAEQQALCDQTLQENSRLCDVAKQHVEDMRAATATIEDLLKRISVLESAQPSMAEYQTLLEERNAWQREFLALDKDVCDFLDGMNEGDASR
jgi:hypothetical protein